MDFLTRSEFLAPTKRRYLDVHLPVKNGKVRIRSLTESEKEQYEADMLTDKGVVKRSAVRSARRRLVALCLVDGSGSLLLSPADVEALSQLDGADLAALQEACMSHVGFKEADIVNLEKNCGAVPADAS